MLLVRLGRCLLHLFLKPLPLLRAGDVHELDGEISAVVATCFGSEFAFGNGGDGEGLGRKVLA